MKFTAFPTWLITVILRPFLPDDHLLKIYVSLPSWHKQRTSLCKWLDLFFFTPIFVVLIVALSMS